MPFAPEDSIETRLAVVEAQLGDMKDNVKRVLTVVDGLARTIVPRNEVDTRFSAMLDSFEARIRDLVQSQERHTQERAASARRRFTAAATAAAIMVAVPGGIVAGIQSYHLFHPSTVHAIPPSCPPDQHHDPVTGKCHK